MDTDIEQILLEAQHRWLRPAEICGILSNYNKFRVALEPANMPPSMIFFCQRKQLSQVLNRFLFLHVEKVVKKLSLCTSCGEWEMHENFIHICQLQDGYHQVFSYFCLTLGGSLFLYDRKVLRYFRKDGHNWRKKKDGKTVREAHERLKVNILYLRSHS